ncbi:uncharacterized protein SCHCODRAFT_02483999 [Schizophyllum commune H4-8]|uniref:uncharacterized protein n=1 Tax=Schizophyllum commune (strain H4-8 / FGSC 9210) TaxID=578458 RepID=UPI00215F8233|nr:uncharacterized protein SCHCODRAFT_02483999 [Schizophyllum commune H4-8]KAI5899336.1 hypothetical protein SCHCODRAFT_02483999 [Schizophyllum commune H4-8]
MHAALRIPEVVSIICDYIAGLEYHPWRHRGLVDFALTCRSFLEPSLKALWEELPSIVPLFFCLPSDIYKITPVEGRAGAPKRRLIELLRVPTPDEWTRVLHHAPRVRYVNDAGADPYPYDIAHESIEALALSFPGSVLFPNARTVNVRESMFEASIAFTRLLISSSLNEIAFDWNAKRSPLETASVVSLLGARCKPTVVKLGQYGSSTVISMDFINILHSVLSEWPQLEELYVPCMLTKTLRRIASYPNLEKLDVSTFAMRLQCLLGELHPVDDIEDGFPALRSLSMMNVSPEYADWALSMMSRSPVKSLTLYIDAPAPVQKWRPIFHRVSAWANRQNGPTDLTFSEYELRTRQELAESEEMLEPITLDDLEPLFSLRNVTTLTLEIQWLMISDDMLAKIATTWPTLESLYFEDVNPKLDGAHLTLAGLAILPRMCPRIRNLGTLPLDTSDVPSEPYGSLPAGGMVCPLVESFGVASLPAPQNPGSVARFLSFIFPNLNKIHAFAQDRDSWKMVEDLLPHMRQARLEGYVFGHAMALAGIPPPENKRPKE